MKARASLLIFIMVCSCGPKTEEKVIKMDNVSGDFKIVSELRGASATNTYKVYYRKLNHENSLVFESRSGTEPIMSLSGNTIKICIAYEDSFRILTDKISDGERFVNLTVANDKECYSETG